jgi:hypothetical protein
MEKKLFCKQNLNIEMISNYSLFWQKGVNVAELASYRVLFTVARQKRIQKSKCYLCVLTMKLKEISFFQNFSVSDKKGLIPGVVQGYPACTHLILDK